MPITEMPDPKRHRLCRRCQQWFHPYEGTVESPELTGPLGAMEALRAAAGDGSVRRFQCRRCTNIRRTTQLVLWGALAVVLGLVFLFQYLGILT